MFHFAAKFNFLPCIDVLKMYFPILSFIRNKKGRKENLQIFLQRNIFFPIYQRHDGKNLQSFVYVDGNGIADYFEAK